MIYRSGGLEWQGAAVVLEEHHGLGGDPEGELFVRVARRNGLVEERVAVGARGAGRRASEKTAVVDGGEDAGDHVVDHLRRNRSCLKDG